MDKFIFIFSRKGSQRLKNKSLKKINGKTLFNITLEFALSIKGIKKVFVSSDDNKLKKIIKKKNCEFIYRPKNLATNLSPEILSWKHAVSYVKKKYSKKFLFISLPVTSPLRKKIDVTRCINEIIKKKKEISLTITPTNSDPYFNMLKENNRKISPVFKNYKSFNLRSKSKFFCTTTVCYAAKSEYIERSKNLFTGDNSFVKVPFPRSIDIDNINDLKVARIFF